MARPGRRLRHPGVHGGGDRTIASAIVAFPEAVALTAIITDLSVRRHAALPRADSGDGADLGRLSCCLSLFVGRTECATIGASRLTGRRL